MFLLNLNFPVNRQFVKNNRRDDKYQRPPRLLTVGTYHGSKAVNGSNQSDDCIKQPFPVAHLFTTENFYRHGRINIRTDGTLLFREKLVAEPFLNPVRAIGTMHDYDVFANVVVLTPPQETSRIYEQTKAYIDRQEDIAVGISHLPNDCGLIFKVLGKETSPVKKVVRQFCSTVRMQVKGKPLPEEFAWR